MSQIVNFLILFTNGGYYGFRGYYGFHRSKNGEFHRPSRHAV